MFLRRAWLAVFLAAAIAALALACGSSSSSSSHPAADDDNDVSPDDDDDASPADDDDNDVSPDDDDNDVSPDDDDDASPVDDDASPADDDSTPDDWVAPWPQSNVEPQDYDEDVTPGPLRLKANDYDTWYTGNQQPYYGGTVETYFTDATRTTPSSYTGWGDSTIWTGTYLGSQAFAYYVTGDTQAKTNAIFAANALDGHLHVTGRPGFIARYRAPQASLAYPGDAACAADENCHKVDSGDYAGDFWSGNTSRDQYTGWFFGMVTAYDLIDDEPTREMISADVAEVVHGLMADYWFIVDVDGKPTTAGPNILAPMKVTWLLIAYHVTGADDFKTALSTMLRDDNRYQYAFALIDFMNRYSQYYGNNLSRTTWYTLLRLGKVYFSEAEHQWFVNTYNEHETYTRLSHNAWFNGIYMSQGPYARSGKSDPYYAQLVEDLTDFRPAPNFEYALPDRTGYTPDPLSVFLHNLMAEFTFLQKLMGNVDVQAETAFPVLQQCTADFLWQRSPFSISACGSDNPAHTNPGVDYLVAYWLAEYHKFVAKDM